MFKTMCVSSLLLSGGFIFPKHAAPPDATSTVVAPPTPAAPAVDLAICLDTSGSMEGLIDAARAKLWAVVNDLALARPEPRLRVALLTFGNDSHPAENGWVRLDVPFTADLDLISQHLFALTTGGGTELVGRVIQRATDELAWSPESNALRLMIVAGNEAADQDQTVRFQDACARSIARGIMVDAIYCGPDGDEIAAGWRAVARSADGQFAAIDHQNGTFAIASPFDARLGELSALLNATYIPYGSAGEAGRMNQSAQDQNAGKLSSDAAAARAVCKSTGNYRCGWDLVDGSRSGEIKLDAVKAGDLPTELRKLSKAELQKHVDTTWTQRSELQKQIAELGNQRQAFVNAQMLKSALDPSKSFDFVLRNAIRAQAIAKGLVFPEGC
ncbi:MAG: vWA domain-containing protein [Planctomycetota bacterium]